jgi:hypothetical protein
MNKNYRNTKVLVDLLENKFQIGPFKFGLDPLLGLVPEIGDVIGAALSIYIVYLAKQMGLPKKKLMRMIGNIGVDFLVGAIPILGDVADFAFRFNSRNWRMMEEYFENTNNQEPIYK